MDYSICDIAESNELILDAARMLKTTFLDIGNDSWPSIDSAIKEVEECIEDPNICLGICENSKLIGWIGLRPMYDKTWELHPLVVCTEYQGKGIGKKLINECENRAKEKGIIGIALGTDDEYSKTSLSLTEINEKNIFDEIGNIRNINNHPYEFYKKCGYMIVGIIPNANGKRKPDIWMWKDIS
ncbi:TPA: AAC(6')-Ia family aminoglycoside 6'-N-acetyltransferase [Pseudomonas aeruginosa]|uniref:AAC(6')-Ia family aminoglycoside 6'-N-acetyltransferase n=1 Tax=Pseudomonas aeruginosa TaxID=287 RepID=UPI00107E7314|nr:AAC(6')-Ia family aminoglycoside 6'-N-acetyltransferase [Pseudomonas aeruginosa]EKV3609957.1 AAC(6')-Ia family aminoglycoside 6'-N-acetyltransferase [Pseudomonas aeruginosa]EKV3610113.1 AAC(6')-Ia family aminoglycoside 6'-N-acetyltransferase [Pseudomonas aeruginosa]EKW6799141.1 AAC(6')-Ia family aminoglycoside 6'-N-acetyltransferase [Pseudomonas aeruginosa]EKW6799319.1 AAC(6')-Ia family aminoglycoside 6'-N-acetyltransferase [Pseudomonas aeruginosa]EMB2852338.1 AAC(6')-Ia family aminoglycosi